MPKQVSVQAWTQVLGSQIWTYLNNLEARAGCSVHSTHEADGCNACINWLLRKLFLFLAAWKNQQHTIFLPPARPHVLLHRANAHVKPPKVHCFLLDFGFLNYCNSFAQKILLTQSLRNPLLSVTCPYLSIFNNERYGACANLPTWNPLQIFSPVTSSAKKQIPHTCFRQPVSQCCATHRCFSPHAKSFMEAAFGRLFRPERSWTILNLPKNYGKLLWTSDPASTWFPRRRYATPHRLVTYPYLGYGICSKVKSKTEAATMTRTGGEMTKGCWLRTHGKKKKQNFDTIYI